MAYETYETIQRLWQRLLREELDGLPPEQRRAVASEFEVPLQRPAQGCLGERRRCVHRSRRPRQGRGAAVRRRRLSQPGGRLRRGRGPVAAPRRGRALLHLHVRADGRVPRGRGAAPAVPRRADAHPARPRRPQPLPAREVAAAALRPARPADRLHAHVQLRQGAAARRRHRQRQLPLPARGADDRTRPVFPRPDHRRGDPRRPGDRAAALRHAGHDPKARRRPALRARPGELRQRGGAGARGRALSQAAARAVRGARHQEVVRRQQQVGRGRAGAEPLPGRGARAVAAGQDGRERPPGAALGRRQRVRRARGPAEVPDRGAARRCPRRGVDRRLPDDRRGPALPGRGAEPALGGGPAPAGTRG